MSGLLKILINHHQKNKLRARQFFFLKACMAASAVVAVADGHACRREALAVKVLTNVLDELKVFDTKHGAEVYSEYLKKLDNDPDQGFKDAMKAIDGVRGDGELTQLLVMICRTISEADGIVRPEEIDAIDHICGLLHIDPETVKALEIDVHAELNE
jgi:tellurite resistance protein